MANQSENSDRFDLVVLGGGPGGYSAAFRAADLGLKVALVDERAHLGGVCLNVGCIPSKALLEVAKNLRAADFFSNHGIQFEQKSIDLLKLNQWKKGIVDRLRTGLKGLARQRKVETFNARGAFIGLNTLALENGKKIFFHKAIIATGSRPRMLSGMDAHDLVMDSTQALELEEIPGRLLIIGGGAIGLEMASIYAALGSEVTVVEQQDQLIPGSDSELSAMLLDAMSQSIGKIFLSTELKELSEKSGKLDVVLSKDGKETRQQFERALVAIGRIPNLDNIGLEKLNLQVNTIGRLTVDEQQNTGIENIFAIGDVTDGPMLAHKASYEGRVAAEVIAGKRSKNLAEVIPQVAYCDPELAWVGQTEDELKAAGIEYERSSFPWMANGRFNSLPSNAGFTKMLIEKQTKRILGVGMVGPQAGDLITEAAVALEGQLEAGDLALVIHPHPTLSEILSNAAQAYEGNLTELYPPRRN